MASISVFTSLCVLLLFTSSTSGSKWPAKRPGVPDICSLSPDPGPCEALFPRYFFNVSSKQCERFTYGGCQGNANNFETQATCESTCIKKTENRPSCPGGRTQLSNIFCGRGPSRQDCPEGFTCNIDPLDRFAVCCQDPCWRSPCGSGTTCRVVFCKRAPCPPRCVPLPPTPTPTPTPTNPCALARCPAGTKCVPRKVKVKCTVLGCPFDCVPITDSCPTIPCPPGTTCTVVNCIRAPCPPLCLPLQPTTTSGGPPSQDVCKLPSEPGPCRGYFPSYYYDGSTRQCIRFIYGGCGGNGNRFSSLAECEKACGESHPPTGQDVCKLPSETGPCYGYFPRYYYDGSTRQCRRFIYGGCLGNANRFTLVAECEQACGARPWKKSSY